MRFSALSLGSLRQVNWAGIHIKKSRTTLGNQDQNEASSMKSALPLTLMSTVTMQISVCICFKIRQRILVSSVKHKDN